MADPLYAQAKQLFPNASDDEIEQGLAQVRQKAPDASDQEILASASKIQSSMSDGSFMKQMVNQDVKQKYGLADRQKIVDQNAQEASGPNWQAGLAALGAGLQGGNALQAGMSVAKQQEDTRKGRLSEFDKQKTQYLADRDDAASQEKLKREMDPNSAESKMAQSLAIEMGMSPERANGLSATKFKEFSPSLQKIYEIRERKLDRNDAREERRMQIGNKLEEKQQTLKTPFGLANNEDDAKKLKDAYESKSNFDNKIDQMIALREKHHGGATFNREDVARGKQLSKDLLLEYKNMAKLGVLSASDEKIINQIIPEDPLQYNSPVESLQGQDSTLARLKAFKSDSDKDFQTKLNTRVRDPGAISSIQKSSKDSGYPKQVRKGNQVATVSSPREEKEARDEGFI